jgi:hypothetical protein
VSALMSITMFLTDGLSALATRATWVRGFAEHQLITLRGLLRGRPTDSSSWHALEWCVGLLVIAVSLSIFLFRVRTT